MPHSTVFSFTDPYTYQQAVRAAAADIFITSPGQFRAELTQIDLYRLWLQRGRESLPRAAKVANVANRQPVLFLAHDRQGPLVFGRQVLVPGEIMIYARGSEHYQRSSTGVGWAAMSLTPDDFAALGRAIAGGDLTVPASNRVIRPPPLLMERLLRLHSAAGQLAATAPEILTHPEVARAIEQELLRAMVGCLIEGLGQREKPMHDRRLPVMQRLERLLEANADSPLYLAEVCAATGVPARTLRQHCLEHLGMGPHQYLWLRRMNLARRSLTMSDGTATTVTAIANDHGFAELGRFAVAYRRLFGEAPSATLRRPAERPRDLVSDHPMPRLPILP
ncbi:MAG TPA: helix-turn-helix domain-containing protein [Acetobacteraceae bacterium]|jgi:AraC-like DNA-binding protein